MGHLLEAPLVADMRNSRDQKADPGPIMFLGNQLH